MSTIVKIIVTALACITLSVSVAQAQYSGDQSSGGERAERPNNDSRRPPKPPIDSALDANSDHVIDADEIAGSSTALAALDANGDGRLSEDECLPPRPDNGGRSAPNGAGGPPGPPVFTALDANGDQVIDADEIAGAETALLTLDRNRDGRLADDECRPQHPHRR